MHPFPPPTSPLRAEVLSMSRSIAPLRRTPRGFSLMELLLVVILLGVIALVVLPRVTMSTDAARQGVRESHVQSLNGAIERYRLAEGEWPSALTDLVPDYLPGGIPDNPAGGAYGLDATTHRAIYTP